MLFIAVIVKTRRRDKGEVACLGREPVDLVNHLGCDSVCTLAHGDACDVFARIGGGAVQCDGICAVLARVGNGRNLVAGCQRVCHGDRLCIAVIGVDLLHREGDGAAACRAAGLCAGCRNGVSGLAVRRVSLGCGISPCVDVVEELCGLAVGACAQGVLVVVAGEAVGGNPALGFCRGDDDRMRVVNGAQHRAGHAHADACAVQRTDNGDGVDTVRAAQQNIGRGAVAVPVAGHLHRAGDGERRTVGNEDAAAAQHIRCIQNRVVRNLRVVAERHRAACHIHAAAVAAAVVDRIVGDRGVFFNGQRAGGINAAAESSACSAAVFADEVVADSGAARQGQRAA